MIKKHPFAPVIHKDCRILILGSLPSVRSVQEGFYYMHPQNRFWKLMSAIYEFDFVTADISQKKEALLSFGIALYDVVAQCSIEASKDSTIQNAAVQDIRGLLRNTSIEKIVLNGKTAYSLFLKAYPDLTDMAVYAPSTSSANASYSLEKLTAVWRKILI